MTADMWPTQNDEDEPDWVKTEREQFQNFRDKDKDGRMNREEVKDWIIPPDYDHSEAEAKHLIFESDTNRVRTCRSVSATANWWSVGDDKIAIERRML